MANAFFSPLRQKDGPGGMTHKPTKVSTGFKEKPGFNTGVPGKKQPKDRSNGIKRLKIHPTSEGL